ncbi:MAG: ribbon-helix-helix protein, CopG family [SAR202 cluster bacterium]|nr:ribbon-helix-helix protein, CopG family [SAR202 cluster bacterium]
MTVERLDVRLDQERRRKLKELAAEQGTPISEMVRRLIDRAYEDNLMVRRRRAAQELGQLELEDVPDPATLSRQLAEAHGSDDLR